MTTPQAGTILQTLDQGDYLTYQLFTASKSSDARKSRKRSKFILAFIFLGIAYLFSSTENQFLTFFFLAFAIIGFIFYPFYSRWRYKKHYQSHINNTYRNRFNKPAILELSGDPLIIHEAGTELKINLSEVEEINEINGYYFIKLSSGASIILSKFKVANLAMLHDQVNELIMKTGAKHNIELDWKWK